MINAELYNNYKIIILRNFTKNIFITVNKTNSVFQNSCPLIENKAHYECALAL